MRDVTNTLLMGLAPRHYSKLVVYKNTKTTQKTEWLMVSGSKGIRTSTDVEVEPIPLSVGQ